MSVQARLDERYGRGRATGRRGALVAGIVAIVLAVAGTAWFAIATTLDDVRADGVSFTVVDEHTVEVGFQVSGPADREIACAVEALDEEFGVVGWRVVVYEATGERTRVMSERVPTIAAATTGLVNSCWVT